MPLVEALAKTFKDVEGIIVMTDEAHMPASELPNVICYETLIADESDEFDWPEFDERTVSTLFKIKPDMGELSKEERYQLQAKKGCGVFGIEMRITDEDNQPLPWDGVAFGKLKVRGPWVASNYFHLEGKDSPLEEDGWFDTGDGATRQGNSVARRIPTKNAGHAPQQPLGH